MMIGKRQNIMVAEVVAAIGGWKMKCKSETKGGTRCKREAAIDGLCVAHWNEKLKGEKKSNIIPPTEVGGFSPQENH